MKYSLRFMKIYKTISKIVDAVMVVFIISLWGSFYTQHHLTQKQSYERAMRALGTSIGYAAYGASVYHKREIRELVLALCVELKKVCNYEKIERMMVKTTVLYLYTMVFMSGSAMVSVGIRGGVQSLTSNATFATVITVWPDVEDRSFIARVARIIYYFLWSNFVVRSVSTYLVGLTILISLSNQFKNLCTYFESLNSIFEGAGTQTEKEKRYEDSFKVGIKMHSLTLRCCQLLQQTGGWLYSMQVLLNVIALLMLMMQMMVSRASIKFLIADVSGKGPTFNSSRQVHFRASNYLLV